MKKLFASLALAFSAMVAMGANPDFRGFYGTNGIIVKTNPATGYVGIDGSAIAIGTNAPASSTNAIGAPITNALWGKTVHMDTVNGNNTTLLRGDATKPGLTPSNGVALLQNGDTLLLRPGIYTQAMRPIAGLDDLTNAPLVLVGKSDITIQGIGDAVIQAGGLGTLWWLKNCTNITFRNLTFVGVRTNNEMVAQSGAVVATDSAQSLRFESCRFSNWQNQGIAPFPPMASGEVFHNWTFINCEFMNIGFTNSIAGGLNDDGCPINFLGRGHIIDSCRFRFNLRAIEFYTAASVDGQYWGDTTIGNCIFEGQIQTDLHFHHTNLANITLIGNTHRAYATNRTSAAGEQYAIETDSAYGWTVVGNTYSGYDYGIKVRETSLGAVDGFLFANNTISNIANVAMAMIRTDAGPELRRLQIRNNLFYGIGSVGIWAHCSFSDFTDNHFISTGVNSASGAAIWLGHQGGTPAESTNNTITGNLIMNAPGSTSTDDTIVLGTAAWNTHIENNLCLAGNTPTITALRDTTGLGGLDGRNNWFQNANNLSVWQCYDPVGGHGDWQPLSSLYEATVLNASNIHALNVFVSTNLNTHNIYVTNNASLSNLVIRAFENDWTFWGNPETPGHMFLDDSSSGRWMQWDLSWHTFGGVRFYRDIVGTNATLFGTITAATIRASQDIVIDGGAFFDASFTGDKLLASSGSEIVESSIGVFGSPEGMRVPGAVEMGSAVVTNTLAVVGSGPGSISFANSAGSQNVYLKSAPTNNVTVTNLFGVIHTSAASVMALDFNQGHNWTVTNRIAAATTVLLTNALDGQTASMIIPGEIAGGTSRVVTFVAHTGHLIANEDDFSVALATSYAPTLTNGNFIEVSDMVRRVNGTNVHFLVTRQGKF